MLTGMAYVFLALLPFGDPRVPAHCSEQRCVCRRDLEEKCRECSAEGWPEEMLLWVAEHVQAADSPK